MLSQQGGAMNEVTVSLAGNVVSDPQQRELDSGALVTNFRLAVNPRRYDRSSARWVDGEAMFVNVTCWRSLATNASLSITKGDPILVFGRLRIRRWENGDRQGTTVEIDAISVGHDLTRGTASFTRTRRSTDELNQEPLAGLDYWSVEQSSSAA